MWKSLSREHAGIAAGDKSPDGPSTASPAKRKPDRLRRQSDHDNGSTGSGRAENQNDALIVRIASLEAALTLSAGIVHDVNNVLSVLSGSLYLLTEKLRGNETLYEQARRARNAAERGSRLLRELLAFDHGTDSEVRALSPADHVLALKPLLSRMLTAEQTLDTDVDERSGTVLASSAQFESALINLVINARDAISKDGTVTVRVRRVRDVAARRPDVPSGDYVCTEVRDNGTGIAKELLNRVTQPLFTTKPKGKGSGLGLTMVRRFVETCGGLLDIDSVEGEGTTIKMWLPFTENLAETTANMTRPLSTLPAGDESVLLIVPDEEVRALMRQVLETLGYKVCGTARAQEAERLASTKAVALIIMDQSVTDVVRRSLSDVEEAGKGVRQLVLLQPGSNPDAIANRYDGYLYQPISVPELARTVRNAIGDK